MLADLRYALRMLAKRPGFTAVAVLTLALGIGINTAMFSFVDGALLKPMAYPDGGRLVTLWNASGGCVRCLPSPPEFFEWREHSTVFASVSGDTHVSPFRPPDPVNLTGGDRAEQIGARYVSANYFETMGIGPALGRAFRQGEDEIGHDDVVILTNRFWQRRFGGDPAVLNQTIVLDERPHTVVGILPAAGIFDRMANDIWLPLTVPPDRMRRSTQFFGARARLKPGVTVEQANAEMERLNAALEAVEPLRRPRGTLVEPLRDSLLPADARGVLLLLMSAVGFVLLIAGVNLANLLLARGAERRREVVIRLAVGAGRWRIVRQLLIESVTLTAAGGAAGVLLAFWLIEAFLLLMPAGTLPAEAAVGMDARVLAFTAGLCVVCGILFGILPAWQAARTPVSTQLQEAGRGSSGPDASGRRNRSRSLLLVTEVALTFVLVTGATLMIRSFGQLLSVDPGFVAPERLLTFRTTLSQERYPQPHMLLDYQTRMLERLAALPGVESAAVTNSLPLGGSGGWGTDFHVQGRETGDPLRRGNARTRAVTPDYFRTMGMRLVAGRLLSPADRLSTPLVVVVNRNLAEQYWPGADPMGQQVTFAGRTPFAIAGVVDDVKHNGLSDESPLEIYLAMSQIPPGNESWLARSQAFVVRTRGAAANLAAAVQDLAVSIDRDQPVFAIQSMDAVLETSVAQPRFRAMLFVLFGALALTLAMVGIYGVMALSVTQRTQEIGIRMALGAQTADIARLVLGQGTALAATGIVLGIGAAWAATRVMSALLFGVAPTDPVSFAATAAVMAVVAVLACWLPARRATKVDPIIALRYE